MIDPHRIEDARRQHKLSDIVRGLTKLRPAAGGFMGICPFHAEKTASFHVSDVKGTFKCLTGDTMVMVRSGAVPIRSLSGKTVEVLTKGGIWVAAPFKSYGVEKTYEISLSRNGVSKKIRATGDHRWFVKTGPSRQASKTVLTKDLQRQDRLVTVFPNMTTKRTLPSPFGVAHGFTFGDGTLRESYAVAYFCGEKDKNLVPFFRGAKLKGHGDNVSYVDGLPLAFRSLPSLSESVGYLYGFLAGYIAADGCVSADGTIMLNSAVRENLEAVRAICSRIGVVTHGVTCQMREGIPGRALSAIYRIHIAASSVTKELFINPKHRERFLATEKKYERHGWSVKSVRETGLEEEVFCAEVAGTHSFALEDNILTGNCFGCGEWGDVFDWLMKTKALTFQEAVEELSRDAVTGAAAFRYQTAASSRNDASEDEKRRIAHAHAIWLRRERVQGTLAENYLCTRGIVSHMPDGLGYVHRAYCSPLKDEVPALIAPLQDSAGHVTAVQQIFLCAETFDAWRDPDGRRIKRTLGVMRDGCVRLGLPDTTLGLAGSVEDALAASILFSLPVWATCGEQRFERVWVPDEIEELVIFADADEPGRKAAEAGARKHWGKRNVTVHAPDGQKDWCAVMMNRRAA